MSAKDLIKIEDEIKKQAVAIRDRIESTSSWISTKNKQFTLPNELSNPTLEAVIVDFRASQQYFLEAWSPTKTSFPVCAAVGEKPKELVPFDSSPDKQADDCNSCIHYQWGSGANGRGKACKSSRILAVLAPDAERDMLLLSVPPTSIKNFDKYVSEHAAKTGQMPISVITQISFNKEATYVVLEFKNLGENKKLREAWVRRDEAKQLLDRDPMFKHD